jgi:hypothetical protein
MRIRRGARAGWGGLGLTLALALGGAAWAAFAPLPAGPQELAYVIPKGTAVRRAAGEEPLVIPARIRLTLGVQDVLVLRNEDDVEQFFAGLQLEPGETIRVPFTRPMELPLACSIHPSGRVTIVAVARPETPWQRLRWRVGGLIGS